MKLQDFRWSSKRKINEVLSYEDVLIFPINAVKTMKIIELTEICERISYLKENKDLCEELRELLLQHKKLILNASTICPGVNTTLLNIMTIKLLNGILTEEEISKLSTYDDSLKPKVKRFEKFAGTIVKKDS